MLVRIYHRLEKKRRKITTNISCVYVGIISDCKLVSISLEIICEISRDGNEFSSVIKYIVNIIIVIFTLYYKVIIKYQKYKLNKT